MTSQATKRARIPLPAGIPDDVGELDSLLAEGGELAASWEGFQPREPQLRMFRETLRAFRQSDTSLIEAGTGTGKTLAYLLAAVISGKRTVVSTGLKNLQDQIFGKDIPFINDHFEKNFKAAVLKGRESYACVRTCNSLLKTAESFKTDRAMAYKFEDFKKWLGSTRTGEVSELPPGLVAAKPFDRLPAAGDACMGAKCRTAKQCFHRRAREAAAGADIILANHHLLMSSLALGDKSDSVVPPWDAAVLDEAHLLEKAAVDCFSTRLSTSALQDLLKDAHGILDDLLQESAAMKTGPQSQAVADAMKLLERSDDLGESVARIESQLLDNPAEGGGGGRGGGLLWPDPQASGGERWSEEKIALRERIRGALSELTPALADLDKKMSGLFSENDERFMPVSRRLQSAASDIRTVAGPSVPSYVYTLKTDDRGAEMAAVPVDVSGFLRSTLFNYKRTVVATSATINAKGTSDFFKRRLGIDRRTPTLVLESPFDYMGRTVLYVPSTMPDFDEGNPEGKYRPALEGEIMKLLRVTGGRALVLFTAYGRMDWIHKRIAASKPPWKLFKQGEGPRAAVLDKFRNDASSVLFATVSFWQGVDVPGQSLSAVIIDKLPFPVPSDPLHQARARLLDAEKPGGRKSFNELSVPEMEIQLKQGVGRLIRSSGDWGVMAVLDPRIMRYYGKGFVDSRTHGPITSDIARVEKLFDEMEPKNPKSPGVGGFGLTSGDPCPEPYDDFLEDLFDDEP
ncbi:MAG: ATP-dependent DNA helicase [Deltaproteobacteria bacterium]|jgi:ATP-dependent DNA helicase DinG|nr:ATP-dependent DNA helicase [Deltaproteobacteria bacterium]